MGFLPYEDPKAKNPQDPEEESKGGDHPHLEIVHPDKVKEGCQTNCKIKLPVGKVTMDMKYALDKNA